MTIKDAVRLGINRIRDPKWAHPNDYIRLDLFPKGDGSFFMGPWLRLYSPLQKAMGQPTPQDLLVTQVDVNEEGWEKYEGEVNQEDTNN